MPVPTPHDVRAVRFATTRLREGYDPTEVDALLDRVAVTLDALAAGREDLRGLTADDVLGATFSATRFRDGYDQDQVDDFLDTVVIALRARPAGAPPEVPATRPATRPVTTGAPAAGAVAGSGAWVREARAQLVPVRLRAGYVRREVDPVLDRAARELDARGRGDARRMTARDVRHARFTVTRWRTGYPQADVDALLARVALALGD